MEYLENLNNEQLKAVTTTFKKVLVVAGAGSGKTRVLTTRIQYLLDKGINPNNIVAFTFTNRAAKEMMYRLKEYKFYNVYTFHSYCYRILEFGKNELGYQKFKHLRIVDDEYELSIIEEIKKDLNIDYNPKSLREYITKRKNNIEYDFKSIDEARIFNQVYYKFQEYLQSRGELDFDDMISLTVNNLDKLSFKDDIYDECKYILVDEFQDTNQIQLDLIKKLAYKYNNIFCVGDQNQLIYSFRSSDIKIINDFMSEADEVIFLNKNYRSSQNILSKANKLIIHNHNTIRNDLISDIPDKFKITYRECPNTSYEAWNCAFIINKLITDGNYNPNEIAVLFRNNYQSNQIEYELKKLNIPFTTYGKCKFFDYEETKRMIALYQFLENKENYILFRKAVLIDQIIYDKIVDTYKHSNNNLLDLIINMNIENVSNYASFIKNIIQNKSLYDKKQLFEELINIIFKEASFKSERLRALKDIIINSEEEDELEIINNLILEDPNDKIMGVNLMTIHKAKGLEFKCVFLISLNDGILPSNIKNNDLLEEERRVCYVGITRAKEFLYLSSSEYHIINGIRKRLQPSLFISEIRN